MTDLIQLKSGRYKDVDILFIESSVTGGNRIIKYNYPGSNKQSIEYQGRVPFSSSMSIWIPHENYYQQKDNILRVLNDGSSGVFTHPTFGDIDNVINGEYTLTEKITNLGRGEITVSFEVDDSKGVPSQAGVIPAIVQQKNNELINQLSSDLSKNYNISLSFQNNFTDAIDNVTNMLDSFDSASQYATSTSSGLAEIKSSISSLSGKVGSLIQSPADLAEGISSLFESIDNLFDAPSNVYGALKLLFSFGEDDPVIKTNTAGRVERKKNRDLLRAHIRTMALGYAYVNASLVDYDTSDDLDLVQREMEDQYIDIRENQLITNESLELLDRVRVDGNNVLDNSRVNSRSVITINTSRMPLSVLLYQYYGNTDLFDTITELNNIKKNAFVEGEVRILSL